MILRQCPEVNLKDILLTSFVSNVNSTAEELCFELKKFFNAEEVLLTFSGRGGLYYLLKSLPEKKVFIPAYTCWVVKEACVLAQKEVHFVDINLEDYGMNLEDLDRKLEPNSILILTHQFGIPSFYTMNILQLARERGVRIIEDNAASFGSGIKGKKTGTFGEASIISMEYSKVLTAGKGGAIIFHNRELYNRVLKILQEETVIPPLTTQLTVLAFLLFRYIASLHPFDEVSHYMFTRTFGPTLAFPKDSFTFDQHYKYRFPSRLLYIALQNLKRIDAITGKREMIARFYHEQLSGVPYAGLFKWNDDVKLSLMRYPIRILGLKGKKRLFQLLVSKGVDIGWTFSYTCCEFSEGYPNSSKAAQEVINLPLYSTLSLNKAQEVIFVLKKTMEEVRDDIR